MKFDEVDAEFIGLRNTLMEFVGEDALGEVTVQPPTGEDEASFLRLTAWSYALIFEAGRISIPYLLKLPASPSISGADAGEARQLVNDLRTLSFHNLGLQSEREIGLYRRTSIWFIENCGANPPNDAICWRACFESLCDAVGTVLAHCKSALETALSDADAMEETIDDLRRRLDRNWSAYKFDQIVGDVALRIGQRLDARKFRDRRLSAWREFLETIPEGDDPEGQITRLIERDVLDHFESTLPIDGRDAMDVLALDPGPEVGDALRRAQRLFRAGITDRAELLECLAAEYRSGG